MAETAERTGGRALPTRHDLRHLAWLGVLLPIAWGWPEADWLAPCRRLSDHRRGRHLEPATRRIAADLGLPAAAAERLARDAIAYSFLWRVQLMRAWRPGGWRTPIQLDGADHVARALAGGRGAILWVADQHGASLGFKRACIDAGIPVHHLSATDHGFSGTPFGRRWLNPILRKQENRHIAERIDYRHRHPLVAMRRIETCLAENRVVSITAIAGMSTRRGLDVLQGRRRIEVGAGPPRLAARTGARLLPAFMTAEGPFLRAVIEAPLATGDELWPDLATRFDRHVRESPALWRFWTERRATDGASARDRPAEPAPCAADARDRG